MKYSEELSERIQACRELYLKHNGEKHELIEQEMRYLGYHDFHRRVLYRRFERGTYQPSWVETYGWTAALRDQRERLKKAENEASLSFDGAVGDAQDEAPDTSASPPPAYPEPIPDDQLPEFPEFKAWLERTWPTGRNWEWKHLNYIYKHLKRVWDGDCKRLMIFMPPAPRQIRTRHRSFPRVDAQAQTRIQDHHWLL